LLELKKKHAVIRDVRGLGLMLGLELAVPGTAIVDRCLANGLLINCTQGNVLRIMPAMTVSKRLIDQAMRILDAALGEANEG